MLLFTHLKKRPQKIKRSLGTEQKQLSCVKTVSLIFDINENLVKMEGCSQFIKPINNGIDAKEKNFTAALIK